MSSTTTSFPTVGDSVLSYVGSACAAKPSNKHVQVVPKGTMGRGKSPTGTMASRSSTKISEADGPRCCVKATLYQANAAEASATTRNVKIMPSATGESDFWKARSKTGQRY